MPKETKQNSDKMSLKTIVNLRATHSSYLDIGHRGIFPQNVLHIFSLSSASGKNLLGQSVLRMSSDCSPRHIYLAEQAGQVLTALRHSGHDQVQKTNCPAKKQIEKLRNKSVEILPLSMRAHYKLYGHGIDTIGQLMDMTDADLMGLGANSHETRFTPSTIGLIRALITHTPPDAPPIPKKVPFYHKITGPCAVPEEVIAINRAGLAPR